MYKNKKDFSNIYIQPEENGAALYQGIDRIFRRILAAVFSFLGLSEKGVFDSA
ncbi:MAG: hypothetical protein SPK76_04630 [Bacteroidales bacterium]|nr:hypothetical protein [Bacteroidales bacterium]